MTSVEGFANRPGKQNTVNCSVETWAVEIPWRDCFPSSRNYKWSIIVCTAQRRWKISACAILFLTMAPPARTQHLWYAQVMFVPINSNVQYLINMKKTHLQLFWSNRKYSMQNIVFSRLSIVWKTSFLSAGNVQAKLEDPRDKCAGNVKLSYAGRWMPVCKDKGLDKGLQDTICRELNCGEAESVDVALYKESQAQGLSGIKCKRNPDSVAECNFDDIAMKACTAAYLKCSGMRLSFYVCLWGCRFSPSMLDQCY